MAVFFFFHVGAIFFLDCWPRAQVISSCFRVLWDKHARFNFRDACSQKAIKRYLNAWSCWRFRLWHLSAFLIEAVLNGSSLLYRSLYSGDVTCSNQTIKTFFLAQAPYFTECMSSIHCGSWVTHSTKHVTHPTVTLISTKFVSHFSRLSKFLQMISQRDSTIDYVFHVWCNFRY